MVVALSSAVSLRVLSGPIELFTTVVRLPSYVSEPVNEPVRVIFSLSPSLTADSVKVPVFVDFKPVGWSLRKSEESTIITLLTVVADKDVLCFRLTMKLIVSPMS